MSKKDSAKDDKKVLERLKKRYEQCEDNDADNNSSWLEDMRFTFDDDAQWPEEIRRARTSGTSPRPCLTVNVTAQHVYQVTNDLKQNRPSIKIRPVDVDGTNDVAEVYNGMIRHIESCSDSEIADDVAFKHSVAGGFGFIRVVTEYLDKDENEQEIYIKPVYNPLLVRIDPASQCPAASDANFAFVGVDIPKEVYEKKYGEPKGGWDTNDIDSLWMTKDTVRIVEYFEKETTKKNILITEAGEVSEEEYWEQFSGETQEMRPQIYDTREDEETVIKWRKATSFKILEESIFPGKWIPIIRVVGIFNDIDGKRKYKGLVRDAKDPQRAYNYWWSTFTETVALQPKTPWVAAEGTTEGHENEWNAANTSNIPVLYYKQSDVDGNPAPPPQRNQLQAVPQGLLQGLSLAGDAIKSVTGQHESSMGEKSNEKSGKAIIARQREGDTATYHFVDSFAMSKRQLGRILVDIIPLVYDAKTVVRILGEDGESEPIHLDKDQQEPVREVEKMDGSIQKIYNINVGKYDVIATIGPSFSTRRQEAVEAMTQIMGSNPNIFPIIGDIWTRNQDWPGSDEIADRLKTMLPPQIQAQEKDQAKIPPQVQQQIQQMQQQLQQAQQQMQQLNAQLQEAQSGNQAKIQSSQITAQASLQEAQMNAQVELQKAQIEQETALKKAMMEMETKQKIAELAEVNKLHIQALKPAPSNGDNFGI